MTIKRLIGFPVSLSLVLLGMGTMPAFAQQELAMTTVDFDIPGTAEVLSGDYNAAITASEKLVDARFNLRKVAARTNLCISYAALRDFENATKWCDAATEINRVPWITANNRAVLHLLMGEFREAHAMLEATEGSVNNGAFKKTCQLCWVAIKENHQEAQQREMYAQAGKSPGERVLRQLEEVED